MTESNINQNKLAIFYQTFKRFLKSGKFTEFFTGICKAFAFKIGIGTELKNCV